MASLGQVTAWSRLGQGQRELSGTGERALLGLGVGQRWCRGLCAQNPPGPEHGTVLSSGLRRRPAFRRAEAPGDAAPKGSLGKMVGGGGL